MHKMLTALLLGATIATPVLAQERGRDDDRRPRAGEWRDAGRPDDRARDGNRDRDRGVQAGIGLPGVQADLRGGDDRRYRGAARDDQRDDRRDGQPDGRFAGRGDGRFDRDGRNDRDGRYDGPRDSRRGDWNGNDRFANNRGDYRWQGGAGNWNRDWRGDDRYDWQSQRRRNDRAFRAPRYYGPRGYDAGYRRWSAGYRIQPAYYGQNYWISRPEMYRLPPAYGGYRWVRYYDDVALVDIRSGLIADILYSFFL